MYEDRLGYLVANLEYRIERRHRLLKDHRDAIAAQACDLAGGCLCQIDVVVDDRATNNVKPAGSSRRMIASAVTLLPLPLSPTSASVLPRRSAKLMPSTTGCGPWAVVHDTRSVGDIENRLARRHGV